MRSLSRLLLCLGFLIGVASTAHAQCFAGLSAGTTASATGIGEGPARIEAGAQGVLGGIEAGCTLPIAHLTAGALARYDLTDTRADLAGAKLTANGRWMAVGTLGVMINPSANLYGLLGVAGTELKMSGGVGRADPLGVVAGAGFALDIGQGPISVFTEYNHVRFESARLGAIKAEAQEHVVRAGVRYAIGK